MGWQADTCTPHRPQTNGIAERAVRRVKEGTRCALVQSGLSMQWWREAMACYCFIFNVTEQIDHQTPYEKRFNNHPFKGTVIPFGAEVQYKPTTPADVDRLQTFGTKTLSGLFLGYAQRTGGAWAEDYYILDWQQVDIANHVNLIHPRRIRREEVFPVKLNHKFRFPLAEGALRQPGVLLISSRNVQQRHQTQPFLTKVICRVLSLPTRRKERNQNK